MDHNEFLSRLHTDLMAIEAVALAEGGDLGRPVPTCPGWTVADLLGHLWSVEGWVREILRTREVAQEREPAADPTRAVADFVDGIPDYLTAMRAITPEEPCWNFGPPPRLARFWGRRQAHEHAIHRVDLITALESEPLHVDPAFAADGVDEVLSVFYPRQVRFGRTEPIAAPIQLCANDTGDKWTLGDGEPVATVTSDAATLYLGLWKRIDLVDRSEIDGDDGAARAALAHALTP